jgi:hypothetical protein
LPRLNKGIKHLSETTNKTVMKYLLSFLWPERQAATRLDLRSSDTSFGVGAMHGFHPINVKLLLFHHSLINDVLGERILQEERLISLPVSLN